LLVARLPRTRALEVVAVVVAAQLVNPAQQAAMVVAASQLLAGNQLPTP
jgi:hypothetical protein